MKTVEDALSKAVRCESRTCFGLAWYATEAEANEAGRVIRESGATVNGGYLHGMPCDRYPAQDYEKDGKRFFAVMC